MAAIIPLMAAAGTPAPATSCPACSRRGTDVRTLSAGKPDDQTRRHRTWRRIEIAGQVCLISGQMPIMRPVAALCCWVSAITSSSVGISNRPLKLWSRLGLGWIAQGLDLGRREVAGEPFGGRYAVEDLGRGWSCDGRRISVVCRHR